MICNAKGEHSIIIWRDLEEGTLTVERWIGEWEDEVIDVMKRLREGDCDMLTVGQYLQPTSRHIAVYEYVTPETFEFYRVKALELGFARVASRPFVRNSYRAEAL